MILYRLADNAALPAPRPLREHRDSLASSSRESILSISYDSKYPSGAATPHRGFIPYVYNPEIDKRAPEPDDYLYDAGFGDDGPWYQAVGWRGIVNISMLVIVVVSLLALFICYPVVSSQHYDTLKVIAKDSHINSTGQYVPFSQYAPLSRLSVLPLTCLQGARGRAEIRAAVCQGSGISVIARAFSVRIGARNASAQVRTPPCLDLISHSMFSSDSWSTSCAPCGTLRLAHSIRHVPLGSHYQYTYIYGHSRSLI